MNSIRAAIYSRVSSEQQAAAHTIESQLAALTERAHADAVCRDQTGLPVAVILPELCRRRQTSPREHRSCQIRADSLENEIWQSVSKILNNPGSLEQENQDENQDENQCEASPRNVDTLRAQLQKLQHRMERLIDSLAEGVIDKDQFTSPMNRTKTRIADIDAKIAAQAAHADRGAHVRSVIRRLTEISSHVQNQMSDAGWTTKREIIRALVQRIEIGPRKVAVLLHLPTDTSTRAVDPIMVTLSRG